MKTAGLMRKSNPSDVFKQYAIPQAYLTRRLHFWQTWRLIGYTFGHGICTGGEPNQCSDSLQRHHI